MPGGTAGFRQMGRDGTPAACCKTKRPTGSSVCWTCELAHRPGQKLTCRQTLLDECRDVKVRHSTTVHGYSGLLRTCSGGAGGRKPSVSNIWQMLGLKTSRSRPVPFFFFNNYYCAGEPLEKTPGKPSKPKGQGISRSIAHNINTRAL